MEGIGAVIFCLFIFLTVFMLPFIVCDLYFAYNNPSTCLYLPLSQYSISFNLKTWLLVQGYGNLAVLGLFLIAAIFGCVSAQAGAGMLICVICLLIFYSIFRLAWLIVGAIMFWGQLSPFCDSQLGGYMWALLIINFIGLICNLFSSNQAKNRSQGG